MKPSLTCQSHYGPSAARPQSTQVQAGASSQHIDTAPCLTARDTAATGQKKCTSTASCQQLATRFPVARGRGKAWDPAHASSPLVCAETDNGVIATRRFNGTCAGGKARPPPPAPKCSNSYTSYSSGVLK